MTGPRRVHVIEDRDLDRPHYAGIACPCHPQPILRSLETGQLVYLHRDPRVTVRRVDSAPRERRWNQ